VEAANTTGDQDRTVSFAVGEYTPVEITLSPKGAKEAAPSARGIIQTDAGVVHWLAQNDEEDGWAVITLESPFLPHGWATRMVPFGQFTRFDFDDLAWGNRGAV
jgi:hypothetical protein